MNQCKNLNEFETGGLKSSPNQSPKNSHILVSFQVIPLISFRILLLCLISFRSIHFLPCFNPSNHGIPEFGEVGVYRSELLLHKLRELDVALCNSGTMFRQLYSLEERDNFLLPKDPLVLLFEVYKGVASFAVPNVRKPSLHTIAQVVANHL